MTEEVRAWSETVQIPTYNVGEPEKLPLFLEKRVYQGSNGRVYPYPIIEKILDQKIDRPYTALFLENKYLKIMVLPEIGGRIHMALDKTNGQDFIYHNQVIKPALVGLAGPWIAGGIEFNWPQHHRPSTFQSLEWRIDENLDGSKTIWCSEIERMFRTKGMHGVTLHPDRAYLEIQVQIYNRSSEPQTFLWWANSAVHAGKDTQFVFPPDVQAVMDHGKRDVSEFPIATGNYYKVDYGPGTDISKFKNILAPTSYMADHSEYDFLGSYDLGKQVGMLHVADHHIVPGKKLWTWGNCDFGDVWTRELTDDDGPYVELMCGAYTDNQPDFSWLMPGEEKSFTQYFYPYKEIGLPQNANSDIAVSLNIQMDEAIIGIYVTSEKKLRIQLKSPHGLIFDRSVNLSPEEAILDKIPIEFGLEPEDYTLSVYDEDNELITYTPKSKTNKPPKPQDSIPLPGEIKNNEELYLSGLHLEQYHHAAYLPEDYYLEALKRDPFDYRNNNAKGLLLFRQGCFNDAERYFRAAVKSLTRYNPNPYDGESFYNLGLALKMQGRFPESFDAFYKAIWNASWQDAGYFELAKLACRKGNFSSALEFTRRSLRRNYFNHKARHLRIAILRRLDKTDAALREASLALELDRMEFGAMWERYLLVQDPLFVKLTKLNPNILLEIALDYADCGLFLEAMALLRRIQKPDPMVLYYLGWCTLQFGDEEGALGIFRDAAKLQPDYCFPNRIECVPAIQAAVKLVPDDGYGYYYLGNFWYAKRNYYDAISCWEKAKDLNIQLPTLYRNLGTAYFNKLKKYQEALSLYEYAFDLDPGDARILFELDQLYKKLNHPPQGRLMRLEAYFTLVKKRDDLILEMVGLYNLLGRHEEALKLLMQHRFHPWEGGEGKVSGQFVLSLVELAKIEIYNKNFDQSIEYLNRATHYPSNLGEGKLINKRENDIYYYLGIAFDAKGELAQAEKYWRLADKGEIDFSIPRYYNDQSPEKIYYQGLAKIKLGNLEGAKTVFKKMIEYGETHIKNQYEIDYFAVSVPDFTIFDDDLELINKIHCNFLLGLGNLGMGCFDQAMMYFDEVLRDDGAHTGAVLHRNEFSIKT